MPGQLIQRGKNVWFFRVFLGRNKQGKPRFVNKTIHGTKREAEAAMAKVVLARDRGEISVDQPKAAPVSELTVGALFDDLLRDYRINDKSIEWAEIVVEKHLRPALGSVPVSGFTSDHANGYIDARRAMGRANATINRELALLRRAFNLGAMTTPPKVEKMPRFASLAENNVRKGFLEDKQYLALLSALPNHLKGVLTFAYYTGCRRGEILSLTWSQVDLLAGVIRLEPGTTKNDEARELSMVPELRVALEAQQRRTGDSRGNQLVFVGEGGEPLRDFRDAWASSCKVAGLWDTETGKPTVILHDLRRTGVRNLVRAGVSEAVAMRISGHRTREVFDRYNIVSEADLHDAARKHAAHIEARRAAEAAESGSGTDPNREKSHTIVTQEQNSRPN